MSSLVYSTEPLNQGEKEQLVLGAAWKVCAEHNDPVYTTPPGAEYLGSRGYLFGVFNDVSTQVDFASTVLKEFC
jgi:hypothetical protein